MKIKFYKFIIFLTFLFKSYSLKAVEFLYPVAKIEIDGRQKIYVVHQRSINHIELWLWDPETKVATKGLLSSYTPASLQILPSGKGFSFIDDAGRIRVKDLNKRSPKAIDLYEPLYNISKINWIDDENFYFSGVKNNKFGIFHAHTCDIIFKILQEDTIDFMYPQKVKDELFYIKRFEKNIKQLDEQVYGQVDQKAYDKVDVQINGQVNEKVNEKLNVQMGQQVSGYKICSIKYPDFSKKVNEILQLSNSCFQENNALEDKKQVNNLENNIEKIKIEDDIIAKATKIEALKQEGLSGLVNTNDEICIVDFNEKPIAFLQMISNISGFVLQHQNTIFKHDKIVKFDCFFIKKVFNNWKKTKIFSFSIPANLILDTQETCLYESILPIIPKYYNNKIYFVDFSCEKNSFGIFSYDILLGASKCELNYLSDQILFSPIFYAAKFCDTEHFVENCATEIFFGGKIDYTDECPIKMSIDQAGSICMDFIKIIA